MSFYYILNATPKESSLEFTCHEMTNSVLRYAHQHKNVKLVRTY